MTDSKPNTKKLFLKSFLRSGLIFGFLIALWDFIDEGKIDFIKIIFMTVFFGAFMAWRIVAAQKELKINKENETS